MVFNNILTELVLIFAGSAILATIFLYLKQPVILSYIALGAIVGPSGIALIQNSTHLEQIAHLGVIFLLFLIGLNLHPNKLYALFRKVALITLVTSLLFAITVSCIAFLCGFSLFDSLIIGLALVFSSTVIGLKLIPTTELHHRHIGEIIVSVLLFQDILAILLILFLTRGSSDTSMSLFVAFLLLKGVLLVASAMLFVKYCILFLFKKFDVIQEYIFIVALGWCLAVAGIAKYLGLSYEIGAFVAGFSLAISPISLIISERFKSLREFFLILFFFALGAQLDVSLLRQVLLPGILIALFLVVFKPIAFYKAFRMTGEKGELSKELAVRLGQASEFSLLVAYTAVTNSMISNRASLLIQLSVIITFVISTYYVTLKYPTPISADVTKRRD